MNLLLIHRVIEFETGADIVAALAAIGVTNI
jgi:hypothetical protein